MHPKIEQILKNSRIPVYTMFTSFARAIGRPKLRCKFAGCYTFPGMGTKIEAIYLHKKHATDFVIAHELAHATGKKLRYQKWKDTSVHEEIAEECLANAVAIRLLTKFKVPYDEYHPHLINFPPSCANKKDAKKAYQYIITKWSDLKWNS